MLQIGRGPGDSGAYSHTAPPVESWWLTRRGPFGACEQCGQRCRTQCNETGGYV